MKLSLMVFVLLAACGKDKPDAPAAQDLVPVATRAVKQLAFEAYPEWSASHPDKACPAQLDELSAKPDPWGHPYRMFCGKNLPAGARGLAIASDGPDGKPDTADDIKSWP